MAASTLEKELREQLKTGADKQAASAVGKLVAERAVAAGLGEVVFDLADNLFFAYTDGTTDTVNPKGEPFGPKRLVRFVRANRSLSTSKICTGLRRHLQRFRKNAPRIDDLTFLALKK